MKRTSYLVLAILLAASAFIQTAEADTFGSGANSFDIPFVAIGNPGNPGDTDFLANPVGAGSVPSSYRIGKYEVSEQMIDKANALGGLGIAKSNRGPDKPVTNITWFDAARFVNWLDTSTGGQPAYKFDSGGNFQLWQPGDLGYNPNNLYRNSLAAYFLPSIDEWYKAAFYNPTSGTYFDYPTGSNSPPTAVTSGTAPGTAVFLQPATPSSPGPADIMQAGGLSPYGTMAQGGNVQEWGETGGAPMNSDPAAYRIVRGGAWASSGIDLASSSAAAVLPTHTSSGGGFRVAGTLPEPATLLLAVVGFFGFLAMTRRF
jgi:sulfatase modifying factor 1